MDIDQFILKWQGIKGGAERANYQLFLTEFAQALDLPTALPGEGGVLGDYQFDGPIAGGAIGGGVGFADLYKKGSFILEAKQSKLPEAQKNQPELFDIATSAPASPSGARYDRLMRDALTQAKRYAVNLPGSHPWPPFLIVCDVGRAFEVYFDWSGNGRGYGHFPDQQSYRFEIERFAEDEVRALFRAIWTDPASIDPRAKSAEVSRAIARRLADVSKWLEGTQKQKTGEATDSERSLAIEETALFLMRVIFCMFAEDVGLLPRRSFADFLEKTLANEAAFEPELRQLWTVMGHDGPDRYASAIGADVRYFNGGLFASARTYNLSNADRGELFEAAKADWTKVEPAIFGTLLEQALTASERAKLGAHYTPRPYVERLVQATIMDVLEGEWSAILHPSPLAGEGGARAEGVGGRGVGGEAAVEAVHEASGRSAADPSPNPLPQGERALSLDAVSAFHDRLATIRVLDPACGTGNFLYVALENLMRLESDVIETIRQLGGQAEPTVGPQQFLGLELNPRAAVIAELVLWIGWLRWRMKNDAEAAPHPVLKQFGNINFGGHAGYDAVLRRTQTGEPDTDNPTIPDWPEAEFIVGNPPFIGAKYLREVLGSEYVEALWQANPRVPKSADFVMQWWDRAAHTLVAPGSPLVRFGFVTTNSITQTFSRRVIEGYLAEESPPLGEVTARRADGGGATQSGTLAAADAAGPHHHPADGPPPPKGEDRKLSLVLAIPDHPWTKATKDAAAVRIAMTVAERGETDGRLVEIVGEQALDTDEPVLDERASVARINADLSIGADVTSVAPLTANEGLASPGVKLHGAGFIVAPQQAIHLGLGKREGLERHIRPYRNGRDLLQRSRGAMVIDLFGLDEKEVRQRFPEVYQHLLDTVRKARLEVIEDKTRKGETPSKDAISYYENWWLMGKPRSELRPALDGLSRYIATPVTAKYRLFEFVAGDILPDDALIAVALDEGLHLGVLSSRIHMEWALQVGGKLEDRQRYNKAVCFDPFPFPDATSEQCARIAELAEELDATRKAALAEVSGLTLTELYNLRERWRSGAEMDLIEQARVQAARAGIVDRLHEQIDAAVADAYGWPADLPPSEIVARLVALNDERAAEEKDGTIRWLRPDYQIPRFAPDS